jgi:hypothetical protein
MKRMTQDEFLETCKAQFPGPEPVLPRHWAFVCPVCRTVQSMESLRRAGVRPDDADKFLAFSCVGRWTGAGEHPSNGKPGRGCNWSLGGLFSIHKLEVVLDGGVRPAFEPASAEQAQELLRRHLADPHVIV